ncbi:MAG: hypothetical protein V4850_25600 [Myxococcota bacterium]
MPDLRLGTCSTDPLAFTFERIEDSLRVLLVNADESGSMGGRTEQNVLAYDKVAAVIGGRADVVILHGFESDSFYDVLVSEAARARLGRMENLVPTGLGSVRTVNGPEEAVRRGREVLAGHQARGTTNPRSHPAFLTQLGKLFDAAACEVELVVLNSSDGGFNDGASSPLTRAIDEAMRRITSRCTCLLAANVLVASAGSPEALAFFTGDTEKFDNRLLFSTEAAAPGVLLLKEFDAARVPIAEGAASERVTVQPGLPCWSVIEGDQLVTWHPEGALDVPARVTVRRLLPKPGGRRMVMRCEVALTRRDVTLDRDGPEVFRILARSLSDNPYLRESSRAALNLLLAPLEALLGTRAAVLAMLTASPASVARIEALTAPVEANTAAIRAVVSQEGLSPRERAGRLNALNNARRLLKGAVREAREALEQEVLDKELGFYESHPNHWLVWLQPAIDELKGQLELTQVDPGDTMAHLSTRIRTAKSVGDGKARAADRYVDKLLAESRARRDRQARKADPRDRVPFEAPGAWTADRCPITGRPLTEGLAAIPFVADRSDLSSGNIMAGGQNVDRMPIDTGAMFSLAAVRELMWGELGQMAAPYHTGTDWYNAAIPVLLGPATPDAVRELERAIGWLATGTSAFAPQMAEAIPGALAVLLGAPTNGSDRTPQVQALLRTSALLGRFRSYPYAAGTAAFDESAAKEPLTTVWARSVDDASGAACLQSLGCVTSLFARAVAADQVDVSMVADDLFAWGCRNIARSVLGTTSTDGRGGVEGVKRLAALLHRAVDLDGAAAPAERPIEVEPLDAGGYFEGGALAAVLGPVVAPVWAAHAPVGSEAGGSEAGGAVRVSTFTDALNALLQALQMEEQLRVLPELDGIFDRLDARLSAAEDPYPTDAIAAPVASSKGRAHVGFDDILALESLRPRRLGTPVPGLASPAASVRRMTKAGETTWFPPADAAVPLDAGALAWLEAHTALYPLRAWLRLADAGLVGQPALAALRAGDDAPPVPPLPRMLPRLAALVGGLDAVVLLLRRSFAFVVANAHGYADNQWATSPLRTAGPEALEPILGPVPPAAESPRRYTAADTLDLTVDPAEWPRLDARGYLPKGRAIDGAGRTVREPPRLTPEEAKGSARDVCQKACAAMLADLAASTGPLPGGLHRGARRVLGEHPVDLRTLPSDERTRVIVEELVPVLAGWVRGDPSAPLFFADCANVLHQMVALGVDTRTLRADEPDELLVAEAAAIRARVLLA